MNHPLSLLHYCMTHYLPADDYARAAGLSPDRLAALMAAGCVPQPAYRLDGTLTVAEGVFPAAAWPLESAWHAPSLLDWARRADKMASETSPQQASARLSAGFDAAFTAALREQRDVLMAYPDVREGGSWQPEAIAAHAKQAWDDLLAGTYGICLRDVTAGNIVRKAVAVSQLQRLMEEPVPDRAAARHWLDRYDAVAMPFPPHQLASSSRGKWAEPLRARIAEQAASMGTGRFEPAWHAGIIGRSN